MSTLELEGRRAVITAAASGMGRAGAEAFAAAGADLVLVDIDQDGVTRVATEIGAQHPDRTVVGLRADLTDPLEARRVVAEAATTLGGLDILWNHAGIFGDNDFEQITPEAYALCMNLNVQSGVFATAEAFAWLRQSDAPSVIFTSSTSGMMGATGSPLYSTAKFAVVGLTKSLALRYGQYGIRVNAICPGLVETPMANHFFDPAGADKGLIDAGRQRLMDHTALARAAAPSEIAELALFLASSRSSYISGAHIPIDGGYTAGIPGRKPLP
ncbi:MAG: SDR family oxidoreductase [Actinomycetales bacterium]|nr:SDR family oxidoreductase [Actinomycetales bacterium]